MFSPAGTCIRHPHVLTCWYMHKMSTCSHLLVHAQDVQMLSPAGTCIRHPHVLTCWYHALAVVGPAPHTSVNNLSTRTCSLDWNSFNLRSSPLWAISQILSASLAPTPCRDRASWGRNSMQCNVCTANHYTDTDRQTDWQWHAMFVQPTTTLTQTDWQWHAMFIQPTTTLTQADRETDSGMKCLYSQPLHWHRQTDWQ